MWLRGRYSRAQAVASRASTYGRGAKKRNADALPRPRTGTHFLVRTCVDRLAGDGEHTIADEMSEVRVKGLHRIEVRDAKGDRSQAILEIRYRRIRVLPPPGKPISPAAEAVFTMLPPPCLSICGIHT